MVVEDSDVEVAARSVEAMASGDFAAFAEVIAADAINDEAHTEPSACRGVGPAAFHASALWLRAAFSELRFDIKETVGRDGLVAVRAVMSGRHTGTFVTFRPDGAVDGAFPPTGKSFAVTQTHWFRIRDGRVVRHWANRDDLGLSAQAGWVPPSPVYLVRMARARRLARKQMSAPTR